MSFYPFDVLQTEKRYLDWHLKFLNISVSFWYYVIYSQKSGVVFRIFI